MKSFRLVRLSNQANYLIGLVLLLVILAGTAFMAISYAEELNRLDDAQLSAWGF